MFVWAHVIARTLVTWKWPDPPWAILTDNSTVVDLKGCTVIGQRFFWEKLDIDVQEIQAGDGFRMARLDGVRNRVAEHLESAAYS